MTDRDSSQTFYKQALARAAELPTDELRRHARVAELEGDSHCRQCFCCACWDVLFEREQREKGEADRRRREENEARWAKIQAQKAEDRKRMGLE
jgi:hypothetical protein